MKTNPLAIRLAAGLFAASLGVSASFGATSTIDVSTVPTAGWTVTGGGATNATPEFVTGPGLSLTSDSAIGGTPVAGFNNTGFSGFWTANLTFTLPAGATDPTLAYSNLFGDDRTLLFLNGTQIANAGTTGPGSGFMVLTDGGASTPFTFTNNTSGTIASGFNVGGTNTLSAIINNTGGGIASAMAPLSLTDGTEFGLTGTLTFTPSAGSGGGGTPAVSIPVPPAAWSGLATLAGLTTLAALRRRRAIDRG